MNLCFESKLGYLFPYQKLFVAYQTTCHEKIHFTTSFAFLVNH
jgi:hypothetical protein